VYVVNEVKQYLIPAVKDVVKEISVKEGVIVVDASFLVGLLD
jgi:ribosomal 30S subunit maturation factor RimM